MTNLKVMKKSDSNNEVEDIVPYRPVGTVAGFQGEFTPSDKGRLPFFSIIQAVGPNSAKFPKDMGGLIYRGEYLIPKPIGFSFFGISKYYRQNLAYNPEGPRPLIFPTAEEVLKNGGNLRERVTAGYDDNNYVPEATAAIVLESTKKADHFHDIDQKIPYGNVWFLPALWTLNGTKYNRIVGLLLGLQPTMAEIKKELAHFRFTIDTKREKIGANWIWSPVVEKNKADPFNSESYVAKLHELFEG